MRLQMFPLCNKIAIFRQIIVSINKGKRSQWSLIWSVIIQVIDKIRRWRSVGPSCLITGMITDLTGRHKVLLPTNHNSINIWGEKADQLGNDWIVA